MIRVYNYYFFDPKTGLMYKGFYIEPSTKKSYFFESDVNSPDYGKMLINTTKTLYGITFKANEKGEISSE